MDLIAVPRYHSWAIMSCLHVADHADYGYISTYCERCVAMKIIITRSTGQFLGVPRWRS